MFSCDVRTNSGDLSVNQESVKIKGIGRGFDRGNFLSLSVPCSAGTCMWSQMLKSN